MKACDRIFSWICICVRRRTLTFFIIVSFEPNMSEFLSKSAGSSRDYSRFSGKIFKNESNHSLLVLDTKIGRLTSVGKSKSLRGFPSFVFPKCQNKLFNYFNNLAKSFTFSTLELQNNTPTVSVSDKVKICMKKVANHSRENYSQFTFLIGFEDLLTFRTSCFCVIECLLQSRPSGKY